MKTATFFLRCKLSAAAVAVVGITAHPVCASEDISRLAPGSFLTGTPGHNGDVFSPMQKGGSPAELVSANGRFKLILQLDGNLVVADFAPEMKANPYIWTTGPASAPERFRLSMQEDGGLIVYRAPYDATSVEPIWRFGSPRELGTYTLVMQDDGNVVVYKVRSPGFGDAIWSYRSGAIPTAYCETMMSATRTVYRKFDFTAFSDSDGARIGKMYADRYNSQALDSFKATGHFTIGRCQ